MVDFKGHVSYPPLNPRKYIFYKNKLKNILHNRKKSAIMKT